MCRAVRHGGRRCRCSGGSRRRAYQRETYTRRRLGRPRPARLPDLKKATLAARSIQDSVGDPRLLGDRTPAYVDAVMAAGEALRAHVTAETEKRWDASGCGDAVLAAADTELSEAQMAAAGTSYGSAERKAADAVWQNVKDLWERRKDIYVQTITDTIGGTRTMGHTPRNLSTGKELSKIDRKTLGKVLSRLPGEIMAAAEGPNLPDGRPGTEIVLRKVGKPGTAGSFDVVPMTEKMAVAKLVSPKELILKGAAAPGKELEYPSGGVPAVRGDENMLPDTMANRKKLESALVKATAKHPELARKGNVPAIISSDGKLGLAIPEGTRELEVPGGKRYEIGHDGTEAGMATGIGRYLADRLPGVGVPAAEFAARRAGTSGGHSGTSGGHSGTSGGHSGTPPGTSGGHPGHGSGGSKGSTGASPGGSLGVSGAGSSSTPGSGLAGWNAADGYTPGEAGREFAEGMGSMLGGKNGGMIGTQRSTAESGRGWGGGSSSPMNTYGSDSGGFDIFIGLLFLLTGSFLLPWH